MKKLVILLGLVLVNLICFGQSGVLFQDLTFKKALLKAQKEKKFVFVDCYTSWCGPCQYMANNVFTKQEAGEYFNSRFVCVKYDMEREGKILQDRLKVKAYPTFFIIHSDGTIFHTIVGGGELEDMIEKVNRALDKKRSHLWLSKRYNQSKLNKQELLFYFDALNDAYDKENQAKVWSELMQILTEKDKLHKDFWPIYEKSNCKPGSENFNFLLKHLATFEKKQGKEKMDAYLFEAYNTALKPLVEGKKSLVSCNLNELKKQISLLDINKKDILLTQVYFAELIEKQSLSVLLNELEKNAEQIIGEEIIIAMSACRTFQKMASADELKRITDILNTFKTNPANEKYLGILDKFLAYYQRK